MPTPNPVDVLDLTADEQVAVRSAVGRVTASPYQDFEAFLGQVRAALAEVPAEVAAGLRAFRERRRAGALLLRGIPLPTDLPATPLQPFPQLETRTIGTERLLAFFVLQVGEPFSYEQWDGGYLVHNKYPIQAHRDIQFGSNAVEFLLHTETPFREPSPEFLALLCLRADPAGKARTQVAPVEWAVEQLPPRLRQQLRRSAYAFETDNPAVVLDGRSLTVPHPLVTERDGRRIVEYVGDLVAIDAEADEALAALRAAVAASVVDVAMAAGQLLLLDNTRVVHGRNAFEPRYDGEDRWLQRMLVNSRLFTPGELPATRLVKDRKFANYPTEYRQALSSPTTA